MITHIWTCADNRSAYQKLDVDDVDHDLTLDLLVFAEEQIKEKLEGDHVHVFSPAQPSPMGWNVFHTCPGKVAVFGDNIVLGEE